MNCSRKYKNKSHLVRHIKYECGISGLFVCNYCNKSFKHSHHLKVIHEIITLTFLYE
ncbi:zinc finger protein 319-like [Acyrthosiphon pisum]|uniref:C2H2-type domain-containing protein n=1 Tax=Acyrthosiphon pisum TaxID=7029 RepID=A0A8R2JS45_ACYPI|nr:zinc finger protein 319-like [Acyrthosiphon pisum]